MKKKVNIVFEIDLKELEYDNITIYQNDEDYDEEDCMRDFESAEHGVIEDIENFLSNFLNIEDYIIDYYVDELEIKGVKKSLAKKIIKNKSEALDTIAYLLDIKITK